MGWINSAIATVAPGYALKREIARHRLRRIQQVYTQTDKRAKEMRRMHAALTRSTFGAVGGGRSRHDFLSTGKSADAAISADRALLREHIRMLEYNNGNVAGPIRRIRNNVVGKGIRFQSRCKEGPGITAAVAKQYNAEAETWFKLWAKQADKRLLLSFHKIQGLVAMSLPRCGEALIVGRISKRPGRIIPYCQEVLEIDRLQTPFSEIRNPRIRDGIEFDDEGVPLRYYVLKQHPGESFSMKKDDDFEEIAAFFDNGTKKVMHIYDPMRFEQTRGYAEMAPGLKDIQDMDRYMEAEKLAALEDACLTGIVESGDPAGFKDSFTVPNPNKAADDDYERIHEFAPNQIHYLQPGEKFDVHRNARPNSAFAPYIEELNRGPANGLDIPPEVYSQNWKGMNYSNARTVLLNFYLSCRVRQGTIMDDYCTPTWECVRPWLISAGKINTGGQYAYRPEAFAEHAWIPPGWQWVDPQKEASGKELEVENTMETLTAIAASKGRDFEELAEERARELAYIKALEEKHGIKFPTKDKQTPAGPAEEEDDDERSVVLPLFRN
jgi:lambda family phage portal protein